MLVPSASVGQIQRNQNNYKYQRLKELISSQASTVVLSKKENRKKDKHKSTWRPICHRAQSLYWIFWVTFPYLTTLLHPIKFRYLQLSSSNIKKFNLLSYRKTIMSSFIKRKRIQLTDELYCKRSPTYCQVFLVQWLVYHMHSTRVNAVYNSQWLSLLPAVLQCGVFIRGRSTQLLFRVWFKKRQKDAKSHFWPSSENDSSLSPTAEPQRLCGNKWLLHPKTLTGLEKAICVLLSPISTTHCNPQTEALSVHPMLCCWAAQRMTWLKQQQQQKKLVGTWLLTVEVDGK